MTSIRARLRAQTPRPERRIGPGRGPGRVRTPQAPTLAARLAGAALGAALAWPALAQMAPQPGQTGTPPFPPPPGMPVLPPQPALPGRLPAQAPMPAQPPARMPAPIAVPAPSTAAPAPVPVVRGRGDRVTLNFVNADIEGVTRAVGAILDQQFVVDPRVRGNMTLYSDTPMTPREVYVNFLAALRGLGYTVVQVGGLYKVVPEADAKLQTDTVSVGQPTRRGDQVVTQIFRLSHENANNLVAVLRPLISPNNTINANPGNNTLVITDYADNLQRIAKIIAAMDTPAAADIEVIPLQHAVASDIAALVQRLSDGGPGGTVPGAVPGLAGSSVLVDSRSNSLIVRAANPARLASIRSLVTKLDRPMPGGTAAGNNYVIHLKNADAVKLATVLRAAFSASAQGSGSAAGGATPFSTPSSPLPSSPGAGFPNAPGGLGGTSAAATAPVTPSAAPSTGGFVQADPATNSLVVSAPEPLYRQVRAMIDMLDSRRAQVYIESMIVEVTGDNLAEVGFQWQGLIGKPGDANAVAVGTNSTIAGPSIIGLTQSVLSGALTGGASGTGTAAPTLPGPGLNVALLRNYFGTYGLAAIARFLQTQGNTNIISTPNLITVDNEEAKIIVGSNVPFITGQFTNTGTATTSPFQTIERKDVGITLRIRPQIGESGTVRMAIFQESSSLSTNVAPGTTNAGPSTNKRSIESTVVVDDGAIIVLGGLIEDRYISDQSKVPLLGDIPYVGALFRSESRTRRRTNLMVFLRPVVLRDGESQNRLSLDRYEIIRSMQLNAQPARNPLLPIDEVGVLPPARRIEAPAETLPGLPQVETPLAAPQTNPGTQGTPAPAAGEREPAGTERRR